MDPEKITDLLDRYLNGTATPAEVEIVAAWYRQAAARSGQPPAALVGKQMKRRIDEKIRPQSGRLLRLRRIRNIMSQK